MLLLRSPMLPLPSAEQTIVRIGRPLSTLAAAPSFVLDSTTENDNFDQTIKQQFERCRIENIIRTDPLASDVLRRQILPGNLGLLAEHEPSLFALKRPSQNSEHIAIDTQFNPNKFNFNKASDNETLLQIVDNEGTHKILVNVSPLMYGHGLLVPWCEQCRPQQLTCEPIELAVKILRKCIGNSSFCIGFNSLGAFSSVNHLHLHVLYPSELDHEARGRPLMKGRTNFRIAYAPCKKHITRCYNGIDCTVNELDWMVPCFSFQLEDDNSLHKAVSRFVQYLFNKRIPHNVLFIQEQDDKDGGTPIIRCIVIPRQHQDNFDKDKHGFNAALGEISGMLIARTKEHFDTFDEQEVVRLMRSFVACEEDILADIVSELKR